MHVIRFDWSRTRKRVVLRFREEILIYTLARSLFLADGGYIGEIIIFVIHN